ncbi:MAG: DUF1257 domain-containing protein [Candidatus Coatesbacteria bacterium]|nr:DUF1257 domain-containing protein [Candidatus Coatesbacteria bacterium]
MSCLCIVVPGVICAWPVLCAAAAAAAAKLGYEVSGSGKKLKETPQLAEAKRTVDLELQNSELAGEEIAPDESFQVRREGVLLRFTVAEGGRFKVCVEGEGKSDDELREIGQLFLHRMVQQYAYSKVMRELRSQGFNIVEEELDEDNRIHIKARRIG